MAGPFQDRYKFIDNKVNLLHRWRTLYYRVKSISKSDSTNIVYSTPVTLAAEPDLIAKEIQLLERTVMKEFIGRLCYLFPVRTFGQWCPNCMDAPARGSTFRKLRSGCLTCYDAKYARGYLNPIELSIQIDPSSKSTQQNSTGETQQSNTTARMGNYPLVKPNDIIVEPENRRWRVVHANSTERLRAKVHHELTLHEIVKGDIEFQIPINISDLKNLEPSPERNFSNAQNMEAFGEEDILAVLKSYGYDHG
ncbi:MAG: hypothetical protein ACFFFC_00355 [Candidatus Thorarchaeota archaeon]